LYLLVYLFPQQLEADYALHKEKVKALSEQAQQLINDCHFDAATISKKKAELERE